MGSEVHVSRHNHPTANIVTVLPLANQCAAAVLVATTKCEATLCKQLDNEFYERRGSIKFGRTFSTKGYFEDAISKFKPPGKNVSGRLVRTARCSDRHLLKIYVVNRIL